MSQASRPWKRLPVKNLIVISAITIKSHHFIHLTQTAVQEFATRNMDRFGGFEIATQMPPTDEQQVRRTTRRAGNMGSPVQTPVL
jgi:hypothetical protein